MAEKEDRWRVAPFVPDPHSRPEERIASALEYIATQIGQINQKMGLFPTDGFNRSTQHYSAGALWHGAGTILPLSANILDIATVP